MKKTGILVMMLLVLILLGVGCGTNDAAQLPEDQLKEEHQLREIDVVLDWYPNALHTFLYVAMDKGYFAEEGLKVNVHFPTNTNDALSLVAANQAEIGLYYLQDIIIARANQNVPVKSIGAVVQSPLNIVLSLKEQGIISPGDLVGKTIGYAGTEISEALIKSIMNHVGADFSDVTMIDVGFDLMSSMTTKNVDATIGCLINHEVPLLEEEGFEVNWFMLDEYGVPSFYEAVFLAGDATITHDQEMLNSFMRACKKGFKDMQEQPEESLTMLLNHQNEENFPLSEAVERKSLEILLPLMASADAPFLSQSETVWQENIEWLYQEGLLDRIIEVSDVMVEIN